MTVPTVLPAPPEPAHTTLFLPESYHGGIRPSRSTVFKQQMVQRRDTGINKIKNWWSDINRLPRISDDLPPYVSLDFVNLLALKSKLLDKEYYDGVMASRFTEFFCMSFVAGIIIIVLFVDLTMATVISCCVTFSMLQLMHICPSALGITLVSVIQTEVLLIMALCGSNARYQELRDEYLLATDPAIQHAILAGSEYATVSFLSIVFPFAFVVLFLQFLVMVITRRRSKRTQLVSTLHMVMRDLDSNYKTIWHRSRSSASTSDGSPPSYCSQDENGRSNAEQPHV